MRVTEPDEMGARRFPISSGFTSSAPLVGIFVAFILYAGMVEYSAYAQSPTLSFVSGSAGGSKVTLTFSSAIRTSPMPDKSLFNVYELPSFSEPGVASLSVSGATITLTLSRAIGVGLAVEVWLCLDDTSCGGNPLTATNGATIAGHQKLSPISAPAAAFSYASVKGYRVQIYFDSAITTTQLPASSAFSFTGHMTEILNVLWNTDHLELTLSRPVPNGSEPDISYTKPATNPLTSAGGDVVNFNIKSSSSTTFSDPGPVITALAASGDEVTLTSDVALTAPAGATASDFKVCTAWSATTGEHSGCTDASASVISGTSITLTFPDGTLPVNTTLWLRYTAQKANRLQDSSDSTRRLAVIETHPFTITGLLPTASTGTVNGASISITFSGTLKTASALAASAFSFTPANTVSAASASGTALNLTLGTAVAEGATLTISYSPPASPAVALEAQDGRGIAAFSLNLTNETDTAPVLSSASVNGSTLTLTFDQSLKQTSIPAASAFAATIAGTATSVSNVAISGRTVTLTLAPAASHNDAVTIAYTPPSQNPLTDASDNDAAAISARSVTNNTPAPLSTLSTATVDGDTITLTFSGSLSANTALSTTSFTFSPANSATAASASGSTVTITLNTALSEGATASITYTAPATATDGIQAADGRAVASFVSSLVNNTDTAPVVNSISVNGATLRIVFDQALASASVPATTAFTVRIGTMSNTATDVAISDRTVTLTLTNAVAHSDTVTVAYSRPSMNPLMDSTNNQVANFGPSSATNNTPVPLPTLSSATVNGTSVTLTFSGSLKANSALATNAFSFTPATTVSSASASGTTVTITLQQRVTDGATLSISYEKPETASSGLQATDGRSIADFSTSLVNNTDDAPTAASAETNTAGTEITVSFSEALTTDSSGTPAASAFSVTGSATASSVAVSGSTVTITMASAIAEGATLSLTYTKPTSGGVIKDADQGRLEVAAFSITVTNRTDVAPVVSGNIVGNGSTVSIGFDQILASTTPAAGAFALTGTTATVSAVAINSATVTLTLSASLKEGASISLAYTPPSSGKLADPSGNAVVAFTATIDNQTDTAPAPISAAVAGTQLTITFDQALDSASVPSATAVAVSVAGNARSVSSIQISGSTATLTLASTVRRGEAVTVSYTKPASSPLRDSSMLDTASFSSLSVVNRSRAMALSASVDGSSGTIDFDSALVADSMLDVGAFSFSPRYVVSSATATGSKVQIAFQTPAVEIDSGITLDYDATAADMHPLRDAIGALPSFALSVTNNTDTVPVVYLPDSYVDGDSVRLAFDQDLDNRVPDVGQFTISGSSATVTQVNLVNGTAPPIATLTLTLSTAVQEGAAITIGYVKSEMATKNLRDPEENDVAAFSHAITNQTDTAPEVVTATVDGATISVGFDQDLKPVSSVVPTHFSLSGTGRTIASGEVRNVNGRGVLELSLNGDVHETDTIKLSYARPSDYSGAITVQDPEGNNAELSDHLLTNLTDTPAVLVSATADGATLALLFDQPLASQAPATTAFAVSGSGRSVTGTAVADRTVTLTVSPPFRDKAVETSGSVSYTKPGSGGLQDDDGNPTESFAEAAILNETDTIPAIVGDIVGNEDEISITFDQPIRETPLIASSAFSLSGTSATIDGVSILGDALTFTLDMALAEGNDDVTLTYAPPSMNPLQDRSMPANLVTGFTLAVSNVTDVGPALKYGYVSNKQAVLVFDQLLSPTSAPSLPSAKCTVLDCVAGVRILESRAVVEASGFDVRGRKLTVNLRDTVSPDGDVKFHYREENKEDMLFSDTSNPGNPVKSIDETGLLNLAAAGKIDGDEATLRFGATLSGSAVLSTFTVTSDGQDLPVASASSTSNEVTLTTSSAVADGVDVQASYAARPGGLSGTAATGDVVLVPSFNIALANCTDTDPMPASITAYNRQVRVAFDQEVRGDAAGQLRNAFSVRVNGGVNSIMSAEVSGSTVMLHLRGEIAEGDAVTVSYAPVGGNRLVDIEPGDLHETCRGTGWQLGMGSVVPQFSRSAVNRVAQPPVPLAGTVEDRIVRVRFDDALNKSKIPAGTVFSMTAGARVMEVVGISGNILTLRLNRPPDWDRSVRLSYAPPDSGALADPGGLQVAGFRRLRLENLTTGPRPVRIIGAEQLIIVEFDKELDPSRRAPSTTWWVHSLDFLSAERAWAPNGRTVVIEMEEPGLRPGAQAFLVHVANLPYRTKLADRFGYRTATFVLPIENFTWEPP